MYLRCETNLISELNVDEKTREYLLSRMGRGSSPDFSIIEPGRFYVACGIQFRNNLTQVLIKNHKHPDDWVFRPLACFSILDARVSGFWHFKERYGEYRVTGEVAPYCTLAIKEWFEGDGSFWYNLFELEQRELDIFNPMSLKMHLEYNQPHIQLHALEISTGKVICPMCEDKWSPDTSLEMTQCPECKEVMSYGDIVNAT